jgi:hypothetical protein
LDLQPSPSHVQIRSLHCAANLHFVIQEALCSVSHLVQNNYTYKRTEFFLRVTNWLNTKPTYWSRTVYQRGNKHSETVLSVIFIRTFCTIITQYILEATCCVVLWFVTMEKSYCNWQNVHETTVKKLYASIAAKSLTIFPVCIIFLCHSFLLVPKIHPHEQCINVSGTSFLKVLYDSISLSDFLVLTHNIPRKIISEEKNSESNMTFLECKIVITYC